MGFENIKTTGEIASVVVGKMFGTNGANAFSLLLLSIGTGLCKWLNDE